MNTLSWIMHGGLLVGFGVSVLLGAFLPASLLALLITYWFRAYGVVVMVGLIDAYLGAFYGVPWLSLGGIAWFGFSEWVRPLLVIANQDTV